MGQYGRGGNNGYGQLGQNDTTNRSSPIQIGALTSWKSILNTSGGGTQFFSAIQTNGTLWTWGRNNYGTLGKGNTTYYSSPVQVGALSTWANVFGGNNSCYAIQTNGTLWAWGQGTNGALGFGNTTSYSSPKQVGSLTSWLSIVASQYSAIGLHY